MHYFSDVMFSAQLVLWTQNMLLRYRLSCKPVLNSQYEQSASLPMTVSYWHTAEMHFYNRHLKNW